MSQKKRPSRQALNRARQRSTFVGRVEQLESFQRNLTHLVFDDDGFSYPNDFLFNIWGQGGVGKTTLLRQFEDIAKRRGALTARVDEAISTVPKALAELARQLEAQGHKLPKFSERYKVYRQKREEIETDPKAPQGFSAFLGKSVARVGLKLGREVPIAGAAIELVDEDSFAEGAGEWATYLAKKLTNKDEIKLVNEPIEVLTPLFLEDIDAISEKQTILLFDTYERTDVFLEQWLLEVLDDHARYGVLSSNCILVIAGREQLNPNRWSESPIVQFPLEPFDTDEATQFLRLKGVTNSKVIETILEVSGKLPLLLAVLAENSPDDPAQVSEASGTAVDRFLTWVNDPQKRQLALDAALPRILNQDVIAHFTGDADSKELFSWLKALPFVRERSDGWAYHDVVRPQMLRYQQRESAKHWTEQHQLISAHYDSCCQQLQLDEKACYADADWQNYMLQGLYHRLCAHPQNELPVALNAFLDALKQKRNFAQRWGEMMRQAGQDLESEALQDWGERLADGLKAYEEDNYIETVTVFTSLLAKEGVDEKKLPIIHAWRGQVHRLMSKYEKSLVDFNRAIELDADYKWAIANRGETYRSMERYEDALVDFNRAIELDADYKWAIAHRGETYRSMERYEDALVDFNR
ncbi:MAG: hypothetical protein AAFZ17_18340, partial [Cyanobacteria bacterium J06650_10]